VASRVVYKILPASAWRQAVETGLFQGAGIDRRDGYIHLSSASQAQETAARHFSGRADLVLVAIDSGRLGNALKWEASRGGALFPHLYDMIDPAKAMWAKPLPLGPDGRHVFPDLPA
jgi:uncharacterized protein (DUF952 family)